MSIVVVGKNSFLARAAAAHPGCKGWVFLGHQEALTDRAWTRGATIVVNCAFDPEFHKGGYNSSRDIDARLADSIGRNTHYVMLSSRLVYGTSKAGQAFRESDLLAPETAYAKAKLKIEKNLIAVLGEDRVTVLRIGNVFGHEYGRKSFFGMALTRLKDEGKIVFDIAPDSKRDFIAAWRFAEALEKIAKAPAPGVFNLGAGFGTTPDEIAEWLIEGYGAGEVVYSDRKTHGQFWLDMSKTRKAFGLEPITPALLQEDVIECGRQLKNQDRG